MGGGGSSILFIRTFSIRTVRLRLHTKNDVESVKNAFILLTFCESSINTITEM